MISPHPPTTNLSSGWSRVPAQFTFSRFDEGRLTAVVHDGLRDLDLMHGLAVSDEQFERLIVLYSWDCGWRDPINTDSATSSLYNAAFEYK